MRACFLGQNVCALGYGVAMVQTPTLTEENKDKVEIPADTMPPRRPVPNRMFAAIRRMPHYT